MKKETSLKKAKKAKASRGKRNLAQIKHRKEGEDTVSVRLNYPDQILTKLDKIAEDFRDKYAQFLRSAYFLEVQDRFVEVMDTAGENLHLEIRLEIGVRDDNRSEVMMPLKRVTHEYSYGGFDVTGTESIFLTHYLLKNKIEVATNEVCPNCWSPLYFKREGSTCPECNMKMGKDMKYLITDKHCPFCNEQEITEGHMSCSTYDYDLNEKIATIGRRK